MASSREIDMLHGPIVGKLILFALPIAASGMLQQAFNAADVAVVGRFAGSDSLAAVGANSFVIGLMVNFFLGLAVGTNVAMAHGAGAGDRNGMVRVLHTSVLFSLIAGICLAAVGELAAGPAHALLGTGDDGSFLRKEAVAYFRIYFTGMPFIMLYNFEFAILRSKGDTRRPLAVLIISGILNVILNLVFVLGFGMAAGGVAIATVIANVFNASALFWFLLHEEGPYRLRREHLRIDLPTLGRIVRIGLPAGIQGMMYSISNVIMQSSINALGPAAIAGTTAGVNAEFFSFHIQNGFNQAATSFVGQNYGAGDLKRCRHVAFVCVLCGTLGCAATNTILTIFRADLVAIFTADAAVAAVACTRVLCVAPFQTLNTVAEILSGSMRGLKRSLVPACISVIAICGVRLTWIFFFYPAEKTYSHLMVSYGLSWFVSMTSMIVAWFLVYRHAVREVTPLSKHGE